MRLINTCAVIFLCLVIYYIFCYPRTTEGFEREPGFVEHRDDILTSRNLESVDSKENKCIDWCKKYETTLASPGMKDTCQLRCTQFGDEIRKSLNYQRLQFDQVFKPNDDLLDDATFYQYNSDTDDITGIYKCWKECNGACVEYGPTVSAWCYPFYEGQKEEITANSRIK